MIKKYRPRGKIVEAVQWTGDNLDEIKSFLSPMHVDEFYKGLAIDRQYDAVISDYICCSNGDLAFILNEKEFLEDYEEVE